MFRQKTSVIIEPAPEFDNIGYAGDARMWGLSGNAGADGDVQVENPYNNSKAETVYGINYSKFFCDYLITENVKIQGADLKITRGHEADFVVLEVLYQLQENPEKWVMAKRFVRRFHVSEDSADQDTPPMPYAKTLLANKFIVRCIYYKHPSNAQDVCFRVNYVLHELGGQ